MVTDSMVRMEFINNHNFPFRNFKLLFVEVHEKRLDCGCEILSFHKAKRSFVHIRIRSRIHQIFILTFLPIFCCSEVLYWHKWKKMYFCPCRDLNSRALDYVSRVLTLKPRASTKINSIQLFFCCKYVRVKCWSNNLWKNHWLNIRLIEHQTLRPSRGLFQSLNVRLNNGILRLYR